MYYDFVIDSIVVLFLCSVTIFLDLPLKRRYSQYFLGVMFGLIAIFLMSNREMGIQSSSFDFRHITMTMAGFIGGPVTALIAMILSSIYRYDLGGSGTMGCIANIIVFGCIGTALGKKFRSKQNGRKLIFWFLVGIALSVVSLIIIGLFPPWTIHTQAILGIVTGPYLVITPFATTILFNFYYWIYEMKQMQTERVEQLLKNLKLEEELSQSNQLIADIIKNMSDGFYALDNQWRFTFVNKKAEELFLKTREELLGKVLWTIDPQALGTTLELNYRKAKVDGLPVTFEFLSTIKNDAWHEITAYPSEFGVSVYYRDITEQKLANAKLIKSQEETVSILESMTDGFYAIDRDLQFTYINRAAEVAFNKSRDKFLGKKMSEVFKPNSTTLLNYHEVINKKTSITFEIISEALGNKWFEISAYPTENGLSCYFRDITGRKNAEATLRQSEEKFSKAFHGGPIMMTLATVEEGRFIDVNETFCSNTGYTREEFIGHTSKELNFFVEPDRRQKIKKMLMEQSRTGNNELDFRTKSGEIRNGLSWSQTFYLDGELCHITGIIDVTEQKRIQKEMANLDRLNLVGQLAAGIAHEIRNPMTTVRGYLQLIGAKPNYADQKDTFALMISELDRANFIITEFLSLAQTKPTELKSQNLNDIVNHLYPLLEADTFTQNKQIVFIPGEIPNLDLDGKEIFQLILNLTRNGLEAMEVGGSLTIKSYVEGGTVVLSIADEGPGIPAENLEKLGIPFFTTKDNGTGLGLATCFKIAESHKAKININSSPSGTTICTIFPVQV